MKLITFYLFAIIAGILAVEGNINTALQCLTICFIIGCSWDIEKVINEKRSNNNSR